MYILVYKRTSRNGSPASQLAGCAKTSNDDISFFKFPSDPVTRQPWTKESRELAIVGAAHPSLYSVSAYCFEADSVIAATMGITKQQRLKPDAVHSIRVLAGLLAMARAYRERD